MNDRSTPSPDTMLQLALEVGELRYRVSRLEQSLTSSATPKITSPFEQILHLLERATKVGPTLVHVAIWLLPKLAMAIGLLAAYLNGTVHAVLRYLLAHL